MRAEAQRRYRCSDQFCYGEFDAGEILITFPKSVCNAEFMPEIIFFVSDMVFVTLFLKGSTSFFTTFDIMASCSVDNNKESLDGGKELAMTPKHSVIVSTLFCKASSVFGLFACPHPFKSGQRFSYEPILLLLSLCFTFLVLPLQWVSELSSSALKCAAILL